MQRVHGDRRPDWQAQVEALGFTYHTIDGDLYWDGRGPVKMLEYNADTPTSLFEAAVVQWQSLQSRHPNLDQFNGLHDKLIDAWRWLYGQGMDSVLFAATEGHEEDFGNVTYLRDTADQAGIKTHYVDMQAIGYDQMQMTFVDEAN